MMQKTLKHEIKADFLLEKGMELLWSKGYNATSVNDIVMAAGVPKGSFYFYFDSKEDFAIRAIEMYFKAHFVPAKEYLMNKEVSPKQRLVDFYEYRTKVLKEELNCKMGCLACNLGSEMAEHNENIREAIWKNEEEVKSFITGVVEEAQEQGEIDPKLNAADVVAFFEDAGKGAMTTMKEMKSAYPIDNFMTMLRNFLLK
ncbi:TetR/AcrR family transcriptional regulator [Poritiphilus flavus]|uniref:TetR family transcriptional regulator n=1 Tax=Poritiphilus flavus TaxID=2697053 RepID=A0A6L9EHV3_9FLAO|nr:TetR/AcrR family transcriptional regulator [Poritiphilus flavus]NAS14235.1 TetR family transcriptional regulator [Poritiphilus flavus]